MNKSYNKSSRKEDMRQVKFELKNRPRLAGTKALCARAGISRSYLYGITRGKYAPSPKLAARLRKLGVEWPLEGLAAAAPAAKEGGAR